MLLPSVESGMPGHDLMNLPGLIRCHHALLAEHLAGFEDLSRLTAEVIAERTGTDVRCDVYPRLLADASGIALKTSLSLWATGTTGRSLADIFGEALDLLSRGLPIPAPAHSADPAEPSPFPRPRPPATRPAEGAAAAGRSGRRGAGRDARR